MKHPLWADHGFYKKRSPLFPIKYYLQPSVLDWWRFSQPLSVRKPKNHSVILSMARDYIKVLVCLCTHNALGRTSIQPGKNAFQTISWTVRQKTSLNFYSHWVFICKADGMVCINQPTVYESPQITNQMCVCVSSWQIVVSETSSAAGTTTEALVCQSLCHSNRWVWPDQGCWNQGALHLF